MDEAKGPAAHKSSQFEARERLILALDFASAARALAFLGGLKQSRIQPPLWVKIGLELFLAEGPKLVHLLKTQGYSVFLDLKLHDIPNTVASAIRALNSLEVDLLTLHASGGSTMMAAATEASASAKKPVRLLAVTVLTSMDAVQLSAAGIGSTPEEQVLRLAHEAWKAGIRGLVASPLEASLLRTAFGPDLHLVTPGIRPPLTQTADDQQRTASPAAALRAGASQLVVGRPITRAADPVAAYDAVLSEIAAAVSA